MRQRRLQRSGVAHTAILRLFDLAIAAASMKAALHRAGVADIDKARPVLNRKQRLVAVTPLYRGSVLGTPVRIAELFEDAVRRNAPAILLSHNHPSGDPTPSADDIRTTREAAHAGRLLGIDVVDHLVFGAGRWVSLRRAGALAA